MTTKHFKYNYIYLCFYIISYLCNHSLLECVDQKIYQKNIRKTDRTHNQRESVMYIHTKQKLAKKVTSHWN